MARRCAQSPVSSQKKIQLKNTLSPITIPFLGLVLFGIHVSGMDKPLPPALRFLLMSAVILIWPGDILIRAVFGLRICKSSVRFLTSLLSGVALASLAAWACMLAKIDFTHYRLLLIIILLLVYVFDFVMRAGEKRRQIPQNVQVYDPGFGRWERPVLWTAAAVGVFFAFSQPGNIATNDTYDHIGYVRHIISEDDLTPAGVLAPGGDEMNNLKEDPRKGALHPVIAFMSVSSGMDAAVLWFFLPLLFAPAAFIAFSLFSKSILPGMSYAAAAILLFMLFQNGIGREFLAAAPYGQNISQFYFWTVFSLACSFLAGGAGAIFPLLVLFIAAGSVIHIGFVIQAVMIVLSVFAVLRYLHLNRTRLIGTTAVVLIAAFAAGLWKIEASYQGGNIMHMHPQALLYLNDSFYIVSPIEIIRRYSIIFWGGIALIPGLFFIKKHKRSANIMLILSAVPVLVCFNPVAAPLVFSRGSYLLHRLILNIPAMHIAVLVLGSVMSYAWISRRIIPAGGAILLLVSWSGLFLYPARSTVRHAGKDIRWGINKSSAPEEFAGAVDAVRKIIPRDAVIISDPLTSYALSAYTDNKVVSVLHQHATPNDPGVLDRLAASNDVLSPFSTQEETLDWLHRFNVDFIVINRSFIGYRDNFMAAWNPGFVSLLTMKFSADANFKRAEDNPGAVIFKVLDYEKRNTRWIPTIPYIQGAVQPPNLCGGSVDCRGVRLEGFSISPSKVLPGEEMTVDVSYSRGYNAESRFPLILMIRLNNSDYIDSYRSYPGNKLTRRWNERRNDSFSRFRIDRKLFRGLFPVRLWPLGAPAGESFTFKLPSCMMPGEYDVEIKLIEEALIPNYQLKDFLYNDDSYSGTVCGRISIVKSLVR